MCLGVFLLRFIFPGILWFLDLIDYFLSHVQEVFSYYLFRYFLWPFLSSTSGPLIMSMLVLLILSQRSLRLSSFIFIIFFCVLFHGSSFHHSVLRVIYSFFCLSYLVLITSSVLFISVCLFFSYFRSLVNISCTFSQSLPPFFPQNPGSSSLSLF